MQQQTILKKRFFQPGFNRCLSPLMMLCIFLLASCESGEALLFDLRLQDIEAGVLIDESNHRIEVVFPETVTNAKDVFTEIDISDGATILLNEQEMDVGSIQMNFEAPFTFEVLSENGKTSTRWNVKSYNNDFTDEWGLGGFMSECVSQQRNYEWYICQDTTEYWPSYNCAPTSIVMACLWTNKDFPYTVGDARSNYHPEGGGWYTEDISNCLTDFNVDFSVRDLPDYRSEATGIFNEELDNGNILLFCVDVHYLRLCQNEAHRVDKYYRTIRLGTGHAIIIKGYKMVDGELFYEAYDPAGLSFKYEDGHCKGRGRYYRADDLYTASFASWKKVFVISDSPAG